MSTVTCPRCGTINPLGASFCAKCAGRLTLQSQASPAVFGSPVPPPNQKRSVDPEHATRSGIDRTETALWLLIVGVLIGSDPFSNSSGIGTTLTIIGVILVVLGRRAFGQRHSTLAFRSALLFFSGFVIGIVNFIVALSTSFFASGLSQYEIGGVVAGAVTGLAITGLTYGLQRPRGRMLLWAGFIGSIVVNIFLFYGYGNGVSFPYLLSSRFNYQLLFLYSLVGTLPAGLTAVAFYLAWRRINKGEIPKQFLV